MSKQTGQFSSKEIVKTSVPKKRKGPFEVWWRYKRTPEEEKYDTGFGTFLEWRCMRKYETRELAEKNCEDNFRKWNLKNTNREYGFQFEVRVNEKL